MVIVFQFHLQGEKRSDMHFFLFLLILMLMMIHGLSQGVCKAGWALGAGKFPPPPLLFRPWTVDAFLSCSCVSRRLTLPSIKPRTQSQVISISGPPMRSTAALVVHQRFRTAQRGSVRRFICRLQSGCGEAMLEL